VEQALVAAASRFFSTQSEVTGGSCRDRLLSQMKLSRRDLAILFPALSASQTAPAATLPSKIYHSGQIDYQGDQKKKGRAFFRGPNHSGFQFEMHETVLGGGIQTHAPHRHEHEEIIILVEGSVETYIEGKTELTEAGSVLYFGSNQMHSVRNAGTAPCRYYVIELRGKES
jgi:XRE family transcriptional regulator, regulator of sulfur utilization